MIRGGESLVRSSDRDSADENALGDSATHGGQFTAALSRSLSRIGESIQTIVANLNLVASVSLLASLASFWIDFRGAYTSTKDAINQTSPVAGGLFPSILVGLTVFVIAWCVVYGWRYASSWRAKLAPDLATKAGLKKLVPDIEACLFFLEEAEHVQDERQRDRLIGNISEMCLSLWEDMQDAGLNGPTVYSIGSALPWSGRSREEPNVEELRRLLRALAPLARRGNVREARRIY